MHRFKSIALGLVVIATVLGATYASPATVNVPVQIVLPDGCAFNPVGSNIVKCEGVTPPPPVGVSVPNVVGMAQSAAASTITSSGLALGPVSAQTSTAAVNTVIGQNPAAGSTVAAGSAVAMTVSSGGGGGGSWTGTCPGFDNTRVMPINWAAPVRMLTSAYGGFGANDIVVLTFTTGNTPSTINLLKVAGAEYQGPPTQRNAAISDKPCDFTGGSLASYWGSTTSNTTSVTFPFTVDNPNNAGGFYPILHVNTQYFVNVKMAPSSGCVGSCDMFFELIRYNNTLAKSLAPLQGIQAPAAVKTKKK